MADVPGVYTPPPPARKSAKGVVSPTSRMAARLVPIPRVYDLEDESNKVKKAVKKPARRAVQLRATQRVDDQWKGRVSFSEAFGDNAGNVWSEPLEIEDRTEWASKEFYWRLEIDQFRVDPLLQGFKCVWTILTAGWTFVDGLGSTTYDEAISNPLTITRVIKAPATISVRPKFRVVVAIEYKP